MTIPLSTTTIAVKRPSVGADVDPWVISDDASDTTVEAGIAAHISAPSGLERAVGGAQESVTFRLLADTTDLENTDRVLDEGTGDTWEVVWTEQRTGLGMDHTYAEIRKVEGAAP